MPDYRAYAREAAQRAGCDPDVFCRQIQQESGFDPEAYNESSGATGICQIMAKFHPDVDPRDPIASLDYSARWMATLQRQYGGYAKALAAYNWGPGNVMRWDGTRDGLPEETRRYLDIILGPGWPEPGTQTNGASGGGSPGSTAAGRFRVARVGAERLNVRTGPSISAALVDRLIEGTVIEATGPAQDADGQTWLAVRTPGGTEGWAAKAYLDAVAQRLRVTDDGVRLREQPSTSATIVTTLGRGTVVQATDGQLVSADGYQWRHVQDGTRAGWVAAEFLGDAPESTGGAATGTGRYRFDPTIPTELQVQPWTCSIRSTMWILKSIGIAITPAEAQDGMSPQYCNSDVGLLDASGAGIVEFLRDKYGVEAFNKSHVSFDDVAGWAGRYPVAVGGRNWGHWSAVRGVDSNGNLVMANPGGTGPRYGQQTLNREQFEQLGWFSAVVIPCD